ncbi:unnamed protein product [Gadus morhua 'NCC']
MLVLSLRGQVQTGKIIVGHPAVPHSRPYMVLLGREMWKNETKYCDGFLISDEFVVTAAHCEARIYYVYVGLHKFINDQTPKGITARRAIPHEDFNKTRDNDLMLLQLSEKVNFNENWSSRILADPTLITMALHNTLVVLMLVLSLRGQVQTGKIFWGRKAVPHSRPYMVLLESVTFQGTTMYCDGFLISDQFVVTAAHCQARIYNVYVGLHKFKNDQTTKAIQVCQAIPHEDFNEKTILNDIMLLQLSEKVNFTDHVRPINLASRVSGWGFSEENPNEMARELREVNVTLVKHTLPADRHVYTSLGESGPSNGDSGGPLVCEGEVAYGVVSGGTQKFKLYTKIPDYLGWILGHMMKK